MGPPDGGMASQANVLVESSSILPKTHRTYHPRPASYIHDDNPLTMSRHVSLPHMHGIMPSTDRSKKGDGCDIKRTTSITSMRRQRSVTGMKRLLPLKLSPKCPGQDWPSSGSIRRSTLGFPVFPCDGSQTILERRGGKHHIVPPPMTIRPDQYRDTPVYTEPGSPLLGRAYYTDEDVCLSCSPGSSCDESCIFQDYESSGCEGSEGGGWFGSLPEDLVGADSDTMNDKATSRTSELSFKCQGDSNNFGTTLFRDEAAWLSSSSPPRPNRSFQRNNAEEVRSSGRDFEAWLDDSSSCDGDDEVVACATILTPSKAHVIDVNRISGVTLAIPPRSSSFAGTRPEPLTPDAGRKSRMTFRDGSQNDPMDYYFLDSLGRDDATMSRAFSFQTYSPPAVSGRFDLAMASPPPTAHCSPDRPRSPKPPLPVRRSHPAMDLHRITSFRTFSEDLLNQPPSNSDRILNMISTLDECISTSSPTMLQPNTPCILAIRTHLREPPSQIRHPSNSYLPPSTALGKTIHPNAINRRRTTSFLGHKRTSPISIPPLPTLVSSASRPFNLTISIPTSHPRTLAPQPQQPNLRSLMNIFPTAAPYHLSALYAHILAYNFLESLPDTNTPPHTNPPFRTTTSHAIPPKVALLLGAPPLSALPPLRKISDSPIRTSQGGVGKIDELRDKVRDGVAWILRKVNGERVEGVDDVILRALVEVVRGCE